MPSFFKLSGDLMRRAKAAAAKRGSSLRCLVAEVMQRLLAKQSDPERRRMTEAPIKLPGADSIPGCSNGELAQLFEQEDISRFLITRSRVSA